MKWLSQFSGMAAIVALSSACSQEQQLRISTSEPEKQVQEGLSRMSTAVEHTGNWIETEAQLQLIRLRVNNAVQTNATTPGESADLQQSLVGIEQLQILSINSDPGITDSEKQQLLAGLKAIESRLHSLLADNPKQSM